MDLIEWLLMERLPLSVGLETVEGEAGVERESPMSTVQFTPDTDKLRQE